METREKLLRHQSPQLQIRCLVADGKKLGNPSYAGGTYVIIYRREKGNDTLILGLGDSRVVEAWEYCKDTGGLLSEEWPQLGAELSELYPYPKYSQLYGTGAWGTSLLRFMQE